MSSPLRMVLGEAGAPRHSPFDGVTPVHSRRPSATAPSLLDEDDGVYIDRPGMQICSKHSRHRLLRYLSEVRPGKYECVPGAVCKQPRPSADQSRRTNLFKGQHFFCQECDKVLNSWAQYQVHESGMRHQKRIKELRRSNPEDWTPRPPLAVPAPGFDACDANASAAAAATTPRHLLGSAERHAPRRRSPPDALDASLRHTDDDTGTPSRTETCPVSARALPVTATTAKKAGAVPALVVPGTPVMQQVVTPQQVQPLYWAGIQTVAPVTVVSQPLQAPGQVLMTPAVVPPTFLSLTAMRTW
eukprot:TRINITY_DN48187_c0_g1_i1.p1 TRINITY_DN48187_c0_g1~~TRINITY_DN48187_c0_g1_i1.p1  ORF type:complete len:301 (+),score=16.80 TRINITY_DN48187_c0_g1_i1:116-1018(+)